MAAEGRNRPPPRSASRRRRGVVAQDLFVGLAFILTLIAAIACVMTVLLQTGWWPIFAILLSLPIGYGLTLFLFSFFGFKSKSDEQAPPPSSTPAGQPRWPNRLPPQSPSQSSGSPGEPPPQEPSAPDDQTQPQQHK